MLRISIALEALTGSFDTDLQRTAKRTQQRTREIQRSFQRMRSRIGGILGGLFAGISFAAVIRETVAAEKEMAQLEARVKSTGGVAGFTASELLDMAGSLQKVTAFGDEAIANLQSILLTFTQVRGDKFEEATEAILNMATALDTDLKSAAIQIGKALNDPVLGVTALQRSGIQLTQQQKDLVKQLVETGDVAGAQGVILEELETQFGGAARAARNTFGGALTSLKNAAGDLLEGSGGNLNDAKDSVEELTAILQDPATISAFGNITAAVVAMTGAVVKAVSAFANLGKEIGEGFARFAGAGTPIDDAANRIKELQRQIDSLSAHGVAPGSSLEFNINQMRAEQAELQVLVDLNEDLARSREAANKAKPAVAIPSAATIAPISDASDQIQSELDKQREAIDRLYGRLVVSYETAEQEVARKMSEFDMVAHMFPESEQARIRQAIKAPLLEGIEEVSTSITKITQEQLHEMVAGTTEALEEVNVFAEQASRNTQGIIARHLRDSFSDGARGIIQSFGDMITDLVSQAIAADIAGKLFGTDGVGGTGGGWLDGIGSFFGGIFGGARATGGPVDAGMVYRVNENEPEFFRPDSGGEVIPLSKMPASSGGVRVTQNIMVQGRPDSRTAQQMQIEAARRQRISTARLG